jgi:hypothetical protein
VIDCTAGGSNMDELAKARAIVAQHDELAAAP